MAGSEKCETVEITTPGRIVLDGLWYGPEKVEKAFVFIHGLSSTVFTHHDYLLPLLDGRTGLLFFNNRGHDKITGVKKTDRRKRKGYSRVLAGQAHEIFTECVDDLDGAVDMARSRGAKQIWLVGHSTGSQKSVYFLSRKGKQAKVAGAILLSPMSDYAAAMKEDREGKLAAAQRIAKKFVEEGGGQEMLPLSVWPENIDAQRFLSLYTPESPEEIFCYTQATKKPATLLKVKIPILVILASKDENRDRPMKQIAGWFKKYLRRKNQTVEVIEEANHGFDGKEKEVAEKISKWTEASG